MLQNMHGIRDTRILDPIPTRWRGGGGVANSVHHLLLAPPIFSTSGFPAKVLLKKFKYSKESLKVMEKTCPKLLTGVLIRNG
jgi:hypothetical protein